MGGDRDELRANMREAIQMHIAGLPDDGLPVPEPTPLNTKLLEAEEVVVSPPAPGWTEWKELFGRLEEFDVPGDYLAERHQLPAQERDARS